jgi:hypothetical protein
LAIIVDVSFDYVFSLNFVRPIIKLFFLGIYLYDSRNVVTTKQFLVREVPGQYFFLNLRRRNCFHPTILLEPNLMLIPEFVELINHIIDDFAKDAVAVRGCTIIISVDCPQ